MRGSIVAAVLVALLVLAGTATARAAGLSGQWTANYQGHPLVIQLKGAGNSYSGTYTFMTKLKTKTLKTVSQIKASVRVVDKITNVILTFTKTHTVVNCAVVKAQLRCIAARQSVIVFIHTHS